MDRDGNAYLDATASLWYCNVGHGRKEIASAIGAQAAKLASCSCFDVYASDVTLELADRLSELSPLTDPAVFLTSGGSDSVDTAAKLARRYWAELASPIRSSSSPASSPTTGPTLLELRSPASPRTASTSVH